MPTMTHTKEQRKAWHEGKKTNRERRLEQRVRDANLMRRRQEILRRIEAGLDDASRQKFQADVNRLGRAAAEVELAKSFSRHLHAAGPKPAIAAE